MSAVADISMVSGYLRFTNDNTLQNIALVSVNNGLPQPTKLFSVRLVSSTGLAPVTLTNSGLSTLSGENV